MAMQLSKGNIAARVGRSMWYLLLLFFAWLMWLITLQYIPVQSDVAFLNVKQDVIRFTHYRLAFFAHVYSSMLVLIAGIIQFSGWVKRHFLQVHRISGRIYVFTILIISGPTGLIMGYYGNGGWIAQTAFCLLAILWIIFTFKGFVSIRSGNVSAHRKWMYRSYALTLSAISLRLWKWLLVYLFEPRPMDVYQVVAWLGWVGNLLIAEVVIYYLFNKHKPVVTL
jgi:uncharacterized membrane protein